MTAKTQKREKTDARPWWLHINARSRANVKTPSLKPAHSSCTSNRCVTRCEICPHSQKRDKAEKSHVVMFFSPFFFCGLWRVSLTLQGAEMTSGHKTKLFVTFCPALTATTTSNRNFFLFVVPLSGRSSASAIRIHFTNVYNALPLVLP